MTASPYLAGRGLLPATLGDERFRDTWRVDGRGNALFAHRDARGALVGFEIKNSGFTSYPRGGVRTGMWRSHDLASDLPDDSGKLVLTVTHDRRVYLATMAVEWGKVEETLRHNPKLRSDREIYLHADRKLPYDDVLQIMAAAKLAGAERMGLVTDPLE